MKFSLTHTQKFERLESEFLSAAADKPKIGYICLRTPLEIIESLDAVPLRIIPREGFDSSDYSTVRPDGCSFCRTIPAALKTDYYHDLAAVIGGACCDQQRRIMDTLNRDLDIPVMLYGAPRTFNVEGNYYLNQMTAGFEQLADSLGKSLSIDRIIERVILRNRLRLLIQKLRTENRLPNALLHKIAASPLPPETIIEFLQSAELQVIDPTVRLLLAGSVPGHWELELIESMGAKVLADVTCLGDRTFLDLVPESGDMLENLFDAYVEKNLCPHRRPQSKTIDYIRDIASARQIDGVIFLTLKYCHPWGLSAVRMKNELGYPFLRLDDDLTSPAVSNMRTRVGAFIEMLQIGKRRKAAI